MTDETVKPLPVSGYTEQSKSKIDLVNQHKDAEERLLRHIEFMQNNNIVDGRWAAIAKTHFEQAFMALNRAVFQPQRISLPEDQKDKPNV